MTEPLPSAPTLLLLLAYGIVGLTGVAVVFAIWVLMLRRRHEAKARKWGDLEARWQPAMLELLAAGERPPRPLEVRDGEELFFVDYLQRHARRLRGVERDIVQDLARPYLRLVAGRLQDSDLQRRGRAVSTLGELGPTLYIAELTRALDDPSPLVAIIAALALLENAGGEHAEQVIARLGRFVSWSPSFLASALAGAGATAAEPLRRALADDAAPEDVRRIAAGALMELRDLVAAPIAGRVAASSTDDDLVAACLRMLAVVGGREHVTLARGMIGSDSFVVRAAAASALGALGGRDDVRFLLVAFEDPSRWVAIHAARALRSIGDIKGLECLARSDNPRAALAVQVLAEAR